MKKTIFIPVFFICIFSAFAQQEMQYLAISQFEVVADAVSESEASEITSLFINEIKSLERVEPVRRDIYELEIYKQSFSVSDFNNPEKMLILANAVFADYLVKAVIGRVGEKISLEINVVEPQTAFIVSTQRIIHNTFGDLVLEIPNFVSYIGSHIVDTIKIGSKGQGSGYIFFIDPDGTYYEASDVIANASWTDASIIASDYRGGGYNDWRLPTKSELDIIYLNLRKSNFLANSKSVWSSEERSELHAWQQRFSDGYQGFNYKSSSNDIIAIRFSTP